MCRRVFRTIQVVGLLLSAGLLPAACGGNAQPAIVTLQPTATFTDVPTPTPPEATETAAVPPSATQVPTRPPTTATPGPSPTSLIAPTASPLPATLTATRAPTLAGLSVEYFTTDSEFVMPGENVTLFWRVRGADLAHIYRLNAEDERIYRWDVNPSGTITLGTRADDRDAARFLLEGESISGATVEQTLLIPLRCPEAWFFEPAPESCPSGPPQLSMQAEQTFEGGRMVWVGALDRIYVVFEDSIAPEWAQYPDNFEEGDPERDDGLVPPPGFFQPIRGFGLVWRTNERVQDRLGWATTPEVSFEGMFQADSTELSLATLYLRMRDGGILVLEALDNEWQILPSLAENVEE